MPKFSVLVLAGLFWGAFAHAQDVLTKSDLTIPEEMAGGSAPEDSEGAALRQREQRIIKLLESGKCRTAEREAQSLLTDRRRISGPVSGRTLFAELLLGRAFAGMGRFDLAEKELKKVFEEWQRALPPNHRFLLVQRATLANLKTALGRSGQVESELRPAIRLLEFNRLAIKEPESLMRLAIAAALRDQGRFKDAIQETQAAIGVTQTLDPVDDVILAHCYHSLGTTLHRMGDYVDADEALQKALPPLSEAGGKTGRDAVNVRIAIAINQFEAGREEAALAEMRVLLDLCERLHGADEYLTVLCRMNLGYYLNHMPGKQAESEREQRQVLAQAIKVLGEDHLMTLNIQNNLFECLATQGRNEEALAAHWEVCKKREQIQGFGHPTLLESYFNIAMSLKGLGQNDKARFHAEKVWKAREKMLGSDHPDTKKTRALLESLPQG